MSVSALGLCAEDQALFEKGVAEFNRGHYFECHDTLEEVWGGLRGENRDFLQGLIQVSVAFYHLASGNLVGAESLFRRALKRFERYPGDCFGFDLSEHRALIDRWLERIRSGTALSDGEPPLWRFEGISQAAVAPRRGA